MIGLICFNSLRYAQNNLKYIKILEDNSIPYELVYWNREGDPIPKKDNWIGYQRQINTFQPFYSKILSFIGYVCFINKTIRKKRYDKIIVLTTQTAVSLMPLLLSKYKEKYIYDYRDVTYENIWVYKKIVNCLVKKSYFTAISSLGFLQTGYLDESSKYLMSHNTRTFELKDVEKTESNKLRIVYWGMVRQPDFNKSLCDYFSKCPNIELVYHGAGFHEEIKQYCEKQGYNNILFTGKYALEDIEGFAKETDYILNVYENDKQQKPAMTVKFYDSVMYQIPMIVTKGSYMGEIVRKNNLGIEFDSNVDDINVLIQNFDKEKYITNNKRVYKSILDDDSVFTEKLLEFAREEGK